MLPLSLMLLLSSVVNPCGQVSEKFMVSWRKGDRANDEKEWGRSVFDMEL